jgi:DNA-binding MarR family transcriptional regulator
MDPGERSTEVADRLLHLLPRFQRWAVTTVQADRSGHDLSLRQMTVLFLIREGSDSPGALARRLRISPAVVTGLLDRLEQAGYLRRLADPSDRRRLRLALTEAGMAASTAIEQMLSREIAVQLETLVPGQIGAVEDAVLALGTVLDHLERNTPRIGPVAVAADELWDGPVIDPDETEPVSAAAAG